jgi:hypothetical protein
VLARVSRQRIRSTERADGCRRARHRAVIASWTDACRRQLVGHQALLPGMAIGPLRQVSPDFSPRAQRRARVPIHHLERTMIARSATHWDSDRLDVGAWRSRPGVVAATTFGIGGPRQPICAVGCGAQAVTWSHRHRRPFPRQMVGIGSPHPHRQARHHRRSANAPFSGGQASDSVAPARALPAAGDSRTKRQFGQS